MIPNHFYYAILHLLNAKCLEFMHILVFLTNVIFPLFCDYFKIHRKSVNGNITSALWHGRNHHILYVTHTLLSLSHIYICIIFAQGIICLV